MSLHLPLQTLQRLKSELEKEKLEMEEYIQGLQEEQENIRKWEKLWEENGICLA